jgi:hypothetical protein
MKIKQLFFTLFLTIISQVVTYQSSLPAAQSIDSENDADFISPDTQVNYQELANYLAEGNWRKANEETRDVLLEATGRKDIGWVPAEQIKTLSCWDLKTIDNLWKKYSGGKFGFSVQLPIYLETGNRPGKLVGDDAYNVFGDQVGWRKDGDWIIFIENLNYSLDAPVGHLPNPRSEYSITGGRLYYSSLAERMVQCNLDGNTANNMINTNHSN